MTQSDDFTPSSESTAKQSTPVWVWLLVGCGCLGLSVPVLGILMAIALPSFLNQAGAAKESEAQQFVGSINRGQQAYHLEFGEFANSVDEIGLGLPLDSPNYDYQIFPMGSSATVVTAQAKAEGLKSYAGIVSVIGEVPDTSTIAELCETDEPSTTPPAVTSVPAGAPEIQCPPGSHPL